MSDTRWTPQDWPRLAITSAIILYFGWALYAHYSEGLEETLKNMAMLAVGFWLGSSKGAQAQSENVGKALDLANTNSPTTPPDVILQPGETAQAQEKTQ